jgi:hypothetical protein
MKIIKLILPLVLMAFCANAQTFTKVFQPNGNGEESGVLMVDSNCSSFSTHPFRYLIDSNFYNQAEIGMITWSGSGCVDFVREFLRFAGISDTTQISKQATITSAILTLYDETSSPTGNYGNNVYPGSPYHFSNVAHIYNLATTLSAQTVTWRTQPAYKHTDSVVIPVSTERFGNDSVVIDITSLVQDLHTNGNTGFMMKLDTEGVYRAHLFSTSKSADASKHPKLKVVYSTLDVPMVNVHTTISVYPNPANSELYVDINGNIKGNITIIDQFGREVLSTPATRPDIKLNVGCLASGLYFVRLENSTEIITSKFFKR